MGDPYVYRYRVVYSNVDTVPVGTMLADKRRELFHTWEILDGESGDIRSFSGERVGPRLCPTCYRTRKRGTLYGHPESHDEAPIDHLPSSPTSDLDVPVGVLRETKDSTE